MVKVTLDLASNFMLPQQNKIVLNLFDNSNNNFGFNLVNFCENLMQNHFEEIVKDYVNSFIGSFVSHLISQIGNHFELFFSISKFVDNVGYSLTQNNDDGIDTCKRNKITQRGSIPEFVPLNMKDLTEFCEYLKQANLRNSMLSSP